MSDDFNDTFEGDGGFEVVNTSDAEGCSRREFNEAEKAEHYFVRDLYPEQVRWFYKNDSNTKLKWSAFNGYDSLRIECQYREYRAAGNEAAARSQAQAIDVRGGLCQVDVGEKTCSPIYWDSKEKKCTILRGTWFESSNLQPLEEGMAAEIENSHRGKFKRISKSEPDISDNAAKKPSVVHRLQLKNCHVIWTAVNQVFLYSEAASSKIYRAVGNKFGMSKESGGTRLYRGYFSEASMEDKLPDVTHLIFAIHGIGQKTERGPIVKNCATFRDTVRKIEQKLRPDVAKHNHRVQILPVEWRSSLKLDGDTVDSITPTRLKGLRSILNASAMDILYYTSPLYRSEIIHGLQSELNRLYKKFCSRNPYFEANDGKVSLVAHSLGVVISYDILTGWNPATLYEQYVTSVINEHCLDFKNSKKFIEMEKAKKRVKELEEEILQDDQSLSKEPLLLFKVENLFCLGSPLAVFLALRGIRPKGTGTQDHILSKKLCSHLYNIYHPSDPVAYRLEPLILKHYSTIRPLQIHSAASPDKCAYSEMKPVAYSAHISSGQPKDTGVDDDGNSSQAALGQRTSTKGKLGKMFTFWKKADPNVELFTELSEIKNHSEETLQNLESYLEAADNEACVSESSTPEDNNIDHTEIDCRIDFELKEGGLMDHWYISALTSHTSYWSNEDVALFILSHIFPNVASKM